MRMRVDKHASKTQYFNKEAYEMERIRKNSGSVASDTVSIDSLNMQGLDTGTAKSNMYDGSDVSPTGKSFNNFSSAILTPRTNTLALVRTQSSTLGKTGSPQYMERRKNTMIDEVIEDDLKSIPREEIFKKTRENDFLFEKDRNQEKLMLEEKCERITIRGAIWGKIELTESHLTFSPLPGTRPDSADYQFGSIKDNFISSKKRKQWQLSNITQIFTRRFNYEYSAFEIITADYKAYYFNLYKTKTLNEWLSTFKSLRKEIKIINKENFLETNEHKRWIEGKLSNFDYLMFLNTVAGRSYNDITQYPIFPWILADYESEEIDVNTKDPFEQQKLFRDLSLPLGAQLKERHADLKERISVEEITRKYGRIEPGDESDFMYGSHYCAGGHIIDYLVRVEPFTSLQIKLQSGRFDDANRIFSSIPKAWRSYLSTRNTQNFKELVPEFFYCPNFLKNR